MVTTISTNRTGEKLIVDLVEQPVAALQMNEGYAELSGRLVISQIEKNFANMLCVNQLL